MRSWRDSAWALAFGVVFGLLGAGLLLVISAPPRGNPVSLLPPPTPSALSVHVSGAVAFPGVYELPRGSRVQDVLLAAGGFLPDANEQAHNLAAPISDGDRIHVPLKSQPRDGQALIEVGAGHSAGLININTAGLAELETLPGIGPALASRIISYREENGAFALVDDLIKVPGIGPAKMKSVKDLICVED